MRKDNNGFSLDDELQLMAQELVEQEDLSAKVGAIKSLLENEKSGKYVTYYTIITDYAQERGLATNEEAYADILERQEGGDDFRKDDAMAGFLIIDDSGSTEFRVYNRKTIATKDASYFE